MSVSFDVLFSFYLFGNESVIWYWGICWRGILFTVCSVFMAMSFFGLPSTGKYIVSTNNRTHEGILMNSMFILMMLP